MRVVAVVAACLAGALAGVGCLLAGLFELQGFGRPRDTDPRAGYLALLGLGLLASVLPALGLWRALLPETAPGYGLLVLIAGIAVVLALLGIALAG